MNGHSGMPPMNGHSGMPPMNGHSGMPPTGGQCDPNPACDPTSGTCCGQCDANPACVAGDPNAIPCCSGPAHDSGGKGDHKGPDCASYPTPREVAACWDRVNAGDHGGDGHHDGPPIDPRTGQPFTKADEKKYEWAAKECEETGGVLQDATAQILMKDGFTRPQLEGLCKGSAHDGPHDGGDHHPGRPGDRGPR